MTWKIVVDTACNVKELSNKDIAYERVPFTIQIGNQIFRDDEGLDVDELMATMYASETAASSACPSPDAFLEAYKGADNVLVLTITSQLSGSYNSAQVAKSMLLEEYPQANIHLIDTLSAGGEIDLLVRQLELLIGQGLSFEQVVSEISKYQKEQSKLIFVLSKVDNLVKNGRLSKLVGKVVGLLNIRLVGEASIEGNLEVLEKPRGFKKSLQVTYDEMLKAGYAGAPLIIAHQDNDKFCQQFSQRIKQDFPQASVEILPTSGLCSFYAEKGGIMIGYQVKK